MDLIETNENLPQQQRKQPATIEELKQWYADRHLPPEEVTRFFIGKDVKSPKAFGIYKDERGECVVYKNKASGERAIRYQGPDEAFAVGEILAKLKDEIAKRKADKASRRGAVTDYEEPISRSRSRSAISRSSHASGVSSGSSGGGIVKWIVGLVAAFLIGIGVTSNNYVPNGYYNYRGASYYHQGKSWYRYDSGSSNWSLSESLDDWITKDNADQYRLEGFSGSPFEDSEWYQDDSSIDDDYDDDDDYDWDDDDDGSWDSDDSDWDSDW